jgi:hypothetical protein
MDIYIVTELPIDVSGDENILLDEHVITKDDNEPFTSGPVFVKTIENISIPF